MRWVAVADTHLYHTDLELPDGDVLVHAGDLLRAGTLAELADVVEWLDAQPHRFKVLVAGNHDRCFQQHRGQAERLLPDDVHYLEDSGVILDGVQVWGSPWQPAYNQWAFNLNRGAALQSQWDKIPSDTDVLITHCPPKGFGDLSPVPGRHGCADLAARVREVRPWLHVFGHIHQDGGFWRQDRVAYLNATTWECGRRASVVDIGPSGEVVDVDIPPPEDRA